jgi:kynurenine formamidase
VLLDYVEYAKAQGISYSTFSTHGIPLSALKAMLAATGVEPRKGDILFIRTGLTQEWDSMSDEQKRSYSESSNPEHAGVEPSLEALEWLWDWGVSAVAGDAISWEVGLYFSSRGDVHANGHFGI